ncbi:MAG: 3-deoxy-D-manno-octulosonic acid transferase [Thermodesulfobacteriota bacterium]|nr:3-deoxy-D-manno-octulosonic acid transferase [Thermodesulfobacteriota bacterium]
MRALYAAYTALNSGIFLSGFPFFWLYSQLSGRYSRGLKERLGFVPDARVKDLTGFPRIWIHAVSLGEVKVAAPIIESLQGIKPDCSIILSTTTDHGFDLAMELFRKKIPVIYAPIDTIFSVREALSRVRPEALVFLETEIWPAWIVEAQRMGIKIALVNGRISVRSIGSYLKFRSFFREVLKRVNAFSMILEEDGDRIRSMGAHPGKIKINGNAKYDFLAKEADTATPGRMRESLNLEDSQPVFIAGSTRKGEESMILDVYEKILKEFPKTVLIIAPRHIERTLEIVSMIERHGLKYQLQSELKNSGSKRTDPILVINTFGELFKLYSIGTIIFCGASLVPLGGQNPLEPAVWGKAVFYGPSMEDFQDAKAMLEEVGAGISVAGPEMLAERAIWFLHHPDVLETSGTRARDAVMKNQNAAVKHARVIAGLV